MKKVVNLLKSTYNFRSHIKKCLKHDVNSETYILAKHYKDYFEDLEDEKMTPADIKILTKEIEEKRLQHKNSDDIQQLLSSMLKFIDAFKVVEK